MFNPSIYQRVKHKIIKKIEKYYAPLKQHQLNNTNITIIDYSQGTAPPIA